MGKACVMMVMVQISVAGVSLLYKLAANDGMNLQILTAYRFLFACAVVVPLAFFIQRKSRPKLTWKIGFQAFFIALFGGSMAQNLFAECIKLTSATYPIAMSNLVPIVTFLLGIIFRVEKLGLKSRAGRAKVIGAFLCIGGAMLLTFYKGKEVKLWSTHIDLLHGHVAHTHMSRDNHTLGILLGVAFCLSLSISMIIQAKMSETLACPYSSTAIISVMGFIQGFVYALCTERDWKQWQLGWNLRLLAPAYMGIMASGIMLICTMACIRMKGPLYVAIFNPLVLIIVAIASTLFLNETLYSGSVLGAAIIICGLYSVLWGKSKETEEVPSKRSIIIITDEKSGCDCGDITWF